MTKQNSLIYTRASHWWAFDRWSWGALLVALAVVLPIASVVWIAATPDQNIWPHLMATTLPRLATNTLVLTVSVGILAGVVGTGTAWLVTMYRFGGARWLQWLLLMPLAIPAYVGAYALVDFLEYAGPVQSGLRGVFGWQSAADYWFFEVRSKPVAVVVLGFALYPYVFLLARSAFREQSGASFEVARALGAGPFARFWRVGLPLARPAIAAGCAIAMMETVADFGVVSYFSVQTLTTGIFSTWLDGGNASGAAQIATVVLAVTLVLVGLEKSSRARRRYFETARGHRPAAATQLRGNKAHLAVALCAAPVVIGFILPVSVIAFHALESVERWLDPDLLAALRNTVFVAGSAAVLTVAASLILVFGVRLTGQRAPNVLLPVTTIGYAAPGAVLGVGLLFPMAAADHGLADFVEAISGRDIGLLMTGSSFAIIYAYFVRFFAIAQSASDVAMGRVSPNLPMAARSLGQTPGGTLARVYLPLIRGSMGTALLLVFVDCVKELPATLLLRPFNFDTLSTRVFEKASLEQIGNAAPAALLVILVGSVAILLLARSHRIRA